MYSKRLRAILVVTLVAFLSLPSLPAYQKVGVSLAHAETVHFSDLWGKEGETWKPSSRLPDFSFAGYHAGDKAIPTVSVKASVKDFGAKGDGTTDDTQAFKRAIAATSNGALFIPAGRYKLSDVLEITKSNLVLRGAGEGKTTLVMTRSLKEIRGKAPYGWDALLSVYGQQQGTKLATVTAAAKRGERTLTLSSTAGIKAGQMVRLLMTNPANNSLGCYLYANQGCLNAERQPWYSRKIVDWVVQVQTVSGNAVTLVRPLRLDVRREWSPSVWQHRPTVQEVGIEQLTIAFPNVPYSGHHKEAGYYAIYLGEVFNSWVRQVTIVDADRGIQIGNRGGYNTATQITLRAQWRKESADPDGATGHYGFSVDSLTQDNLISESELHTTFVHNLTVNSFANGNVYAGILSESGRLDHHAAAPYENLYTEIVLTKTATDLLKSGGNRADEPNSGARTTLWNIMSLSGGFGTLKTDKFPQINVIGIDQWDTKKTTDRQWIERWPGGLTSPANLYEAQLQKRRGQKGDDVLPPSDPPAPDPAESGQAVTASAWEGSNVPANTLDGELSTRWSAEGDGQWIMYDLGSQMAVSQVAIAWYHGTKRQSFFAIEVSSNGTDWTEVYSGESSGQTLNLEPYRFAAVSARYVRIVGYGNTDTLKGQWNSLTEVEVSNQQDTGALPEPEEVLPVQPPAGPVQLWFEAEAGTLAKPMVAATDTRASGGRYIWVPNGAASSLAMATYRFTVPVAGTYVVWGRVISNSSKDDSFWAVMDNVSPIRWDTRHGGVETWVWGAIPIRFTLNAGTHTLQIRHREDGTKLDKLLITNDLSVIPNS